jgi:TM2 domain-containing membrane protein YozV
MSSSIPGPDSQLVPLPPPPATTPMPSAAPAGPVKNPWVAAGMSFFFPGLGQVYNGQIAKAFVFFGAFVSCIYAVIQIDPLPFAFGIPFAYLFGIVDAFRSAALAGLKGNKVDEVEPESPAWGITLVVLGLVLLLNNLGWLSLAALARYWPLLLIVAGGLFIRSSIRKSAAEKGNGGISL